MIKQETMFSDTAAELNSLRPDETDLEKLRRIERSIFIEMAAAEHTRSSAMENYCHHRWSDRGIADGRRTVRTGAAGVWTVGGCDEEQREIRG